MTYWVLRDVLAGAALQNLRARLDELPHTQGLATNPHAQGLKHNEQAQPGPAARELSQQVMQALFKHRLFGPLSLPKRTSEPFFARYDPGMYYGKHIDDPVMRGTQSLRTDLSCTLFLCDPDDYTGGELVVGEGDDAPRLKLPAGSAVIYPGNSVHQITEVSSGRRSVALCWIESMVRSHEQRQMVFSLDEAVAELSGSGSADSDVVRRIAQVRANLLRMWADT